MNMKKLIWALPFLVAILTVTSLYAANAERLDPGQMWIPLGLGIVVSGIFLLLFWLLKWTSHAAPFVAAVFTLCFLIWNEAPVWIMGILLVLALLVGIRKKLHPVAHRASAVLALTMTIAIPVSLIMGMVLHISDPGKVEGSFSPMPGQPNIYFIVPDRMPSPAAMLESGIDPGDTVRDLQDLGFFVPEDLESQDPYVAGMRGSFYVGTTEVKIHTTRTMRFFASVLNGGEEVPLGISYAAARSLINQGTIFDLLHDRGYTVTNVASWFNETAGITSADRTLKFTDVGLLERLTADELSVAYFSRTMLAGLNFRVWESDASQFKVESARHNWQAESLVDLARSGQTSQFIMAHIMLPHEPFIYTIARNRMDQYKDQIRYSLLYLDSLATRIHEADPNAVIIIQSDEGMAFRKPADLNDTLSPRQWNGVFAGWYFPDQPPDLGNISRITEILDIVVKLK